MKIRRRKLIFCNLSWFGSIFSFARRKSNFMWYVYVIKSTEGLVYTGMTTDVFRRVQEHNFGNSDVGRGGSGKWERGHLCMIKLN